jgi:glycosyltransferase involved in cell wall biosynthesis
MQACTRVVVINDFSTSNGGASAIAIQNAITMVEKGIRVTFISADAQVNELLVSKGVECVVLDGEALNPNNPIKGLVVGLHNQTARKFIAEWITNHDTETTIYHVHCWSKIFSPSIYLALKTVSSRLVIHAHDYFPVCPNGSFVHYSTNTDCTLKPCSAKCLTSSCDQRSYTHKLWRFARGTMRNTWVNFSRTKAKMILLHETMRPYFLRGDFTHANLEVIPNPVVPYRAVRIKAEMNKTFVFIGRVVPEKGADTFLAAARKAGVPAKVIGDGEALADLKAAYPEAEYVGWQNHAGISEHIANARAVILPSKMRETFGLVSVEALASGLPVVVSSMSPLSDDIVKYGFGTAADAEDESQFITIMKKLASDDILIESMSKKGSLDWQKLALTPSNWGESLLSLYSGMITAQKKSD